MTTTDWREKLGPLAPRASVLVPCYNEADALPLLVEQVRKHFSERFGKKWEMVLVDDGSMDGTTEQIRLLCATNPRIKGVILSRNFGHQPAVSAGLQECSGHMVGIVDCDLQDPIEILMELYQQVEMEGYDVAFGVRARREGPLFLRFLYRTFYRLIAAFSDHPWQLDSGDFCVMNAKAVRLIGSLPEKVRMLRGLRSWIGLKQIGLPYDRPRRIAGKSKYNLWRLTGLGLNAFVGFSSLPLRLASACGVLSGIVAVGLAFLFLANRLFPELFPWGYSLRANPGVATLAILMTLIGSIILICLGVIGEYVNLLVKEIKGRPGVIVAEVIHNKAKPRA